MDSTRLPGKVLSDLCGRPLLGRVLDRVRLVQGCSHILIATSDRALDEPILSFADTEGVEAFAGDSADVAGRALACCEGRDIDRFVRISGDSPFIPPELVDQAIGISQSDDADLVTNVYPRSWPFGASVEVITASALRDAHPHMTTEEREHVTSYFYSSPKALRIVNIAAPDDQYAGVRLTVDTQQDLERTRSLIDQLAPDPETASLDLVVSLCSQLADETQAETA